jgi:hypothetical protein
MEYTELPEFSRELRRLSKKYLSLSDDIKKLKGVLPGLSVGNAGKHWNCLHQDEQVCVYKIRLACRYLRATTMRVVYAQHADSGLIVFIEIYYKSEKENEDRARIQAYIKSLGR